MTVAKANCQSFLLCVVASLPAFFTVQSKSAELWVTGFYWSPTSANYSAAQIPWTSLTHVNQIGIQPKSNCTVNENSYHVSSSRDALIKGAHQHGKKVLITLIHDEGAKQILNCTSPDNLDFFVESLTNYIRRHQYDGIDIDWEEAVNPAQYRALIRSLRLRLVNALITVDIAVHQRSYVHAVEKDLDRINIMNYDMSYADYSGTPHYAAWHNAALTSRQEPFKYHSAESNLRYLLQSGIASSKIVFGIPYYGYVFRACAPSERRKSCPNSILNPRDPYRPGTLKRIHIEYGRFITSCFGASKVSWDEDAMAPFVAYPGRPAKLHFANKDCHESAFVSIPSPLQVRLAATSALKDGLGGVMMFALHQEYLGREHGMRRYPLTNEIRQAIDSYEATDSQP